MSVGKVIVRKAQTVLFEYLPPLLFVMESAQHFTSDNHNTTSPHAMYIGSFYSPSAKIHHPRSRLRTDAEEKTKPKTKLKTKTTGKSGDLSGAMVDNKGWRKKIGSKPKELPRIKIASDETAAAPPTESLAVVDLTDRRRHGWRKTIAVGHPSTPITPAPPTAAQEDTEDTRSERSEASTLRRDSKPKLIRYTSLFATHKEKPSSPVFSFFEPWDADGPPAQEDPWSYIGTISVMESIHSYMCNDHMVLAPVEFNNGLLRIFDDYRKLRKH
jgi:hypothetical protein